MRAFGLIAAAVLCAAASFAAIQPVGNPLTSASLATAPHRTRTAPLPATAWTGLAMVTGIIIAGAVRRRAK